MSSFYSPDELRELGLKSFGNNVLISKKASIYGASSISMGNNVRIDDFCILSGSITLGSNIHISAYCVLYGSEGIEMEDYTGISARCTLYSAIDDFSGEFAVGAMVDNSLRHVIGGKVILRRYAQLGASCVVMPNLIIEEGVAVGAMSFVNKSLEAWTIYTGCPARKMKVRSRNLVELINQQCSNV